MHEAVNEAVERARRGEGPTFIEAQTFRHRGHFEGDPYDYINPDVLKDWKENRDPINNFKALLLANNIFSENELAAVNEQINCEILEAINKAEAGGLPNPQRIYEGLFA